MVQIKKENEIFTYTDYLQWPDEERWELIDGVPFDMSAAPRPFHQTILLNLAFVIKEFVEGKKCRVFVAPYDVRFTEKNQKDENSLNVVQPDITVVCDPSKLDDKGCKGAPDFIAEITSPSTAIKDMKYKLPLYATG